MGPIPLLWIQRVNRAPPDHPGTQRQDRQAGITHGGANSRNLSTASPKRQGAMTILPENQLGAIITQPTNQLSCFGDGLIRRRYRVGGKNFVGMNRS